MFAQLTEYLLRYKSVSIPHVGSFVVEREPAQLDFADKRIHPPVYSVTYRDAVNVEEQQLCFISDAYADPSVRQEQLENFGRRLKRRIETGSFTWKGIGSLQCVEDKIVFQPQTLTTGLWPVEAYRVVRENVPHTLLVGDQEVQSSDVQNLWDEPVERKKDVAVIVGWAILIAAVLFIAYLFFQGGLRTENTGLKARPKIELGPVQHN